MFALIVISVCCSRTYEAASAIIDGEEVDCFVNCACCKGGVARCAFDPRYGDNYCADGCVDGITGNRCKNVCRGNCKACAHNNGMPCFSCKETFYDTDSFCNKSCSVGCMSGSCAKDGSCDCTSRFEGTKCDSCIQGKYGTNCTSQCLHQNCRCTDKTGCDSCKPGFFNTKAFCEASCSPGCINVTCNNDGVCVCREQFTGSGCAECVHGYYGENCNRLCSVGCVGRGCSTNGTCSLCYPGYYGDACHFICSIGCNGEICLKNGSCLECIDGYYGDHCNMKCSNGCAGGICMRDGSCFKCIPGHYGENCSITCTGDVLIRNGTHMCIEAKDGLDIHHTETGVSVGFAVGATCLGVVTGIIISLIGAYIWKRRITRKDIEAPKPLTTNNTTGGSTMTNGQDYEQIDQNNRIMSQEQLAYGVLEMTPVQPDPGNHRNGTTFNEDNSNATNLD